MHQKQTTTTMKTYFVTTQTGVNKCLLHSLMKAEYSTTDLADAQRVFDAEVEELRRTYKTADEFEYCPNDDETNHAYYCSITAIDDEDPDNVEFLQDSDYFYE